MPKKTYNEKLRSPGDLPKIEDLSDKPQAVAHYGGAKLLIAAPMQYNDLMARVPEGRVITADRLRAHLAAQAGADATCPLTAGLFINICAHASEERGDDPIPWWRTLKAGGELNEKYPGGVEAQKLFLEAEGHEVFQRGKRWFVRGYEERLMDLGAPAPGSPRDLTDEERTALYPIILSEYNLAWPQWFAEEKAALERLLGPENIVRLQHIGSTAVPGLLAKPTVDILLEITETADMDILLAVLPDPPYIPLREEMTPGERITVVKGYTSEGFAERVYHIHMRRPGDWDEIIFRDYLRAHADAAAEYAALKRRLQREYEYDRDGYTDAKGAFIRTITEKARIEGKQ